MRKVVTTNVAFSVVAALLLAASSTNAALIRTFDFEGSDTDLTLYGSAALSTEQAVTGSQSVKIPQGASYYNDYTEMLPGLTDTNIGTVVMRIYVESTGGRVDDNAQVIMMEDPSYTCLGINYGWPVGGELGYRDYYEQHAWKATGKTLSTDAWYTVAVAFNGKAGTEESRVFSIWAAQGTDVTPADLLVDEESFDLGAFSFDLLSANGTGGTAWYMDNVQIYDSYGEGIVPEPSTVAMLLLVGLCAFGFCRKR